MSHRKILLSVAAACFLPIDSMSLDLARHCPRTVIMGLYGLHSRASLQRRCQFGPCSMLVSSTSLGAFPHSLHEVAKNEAQNHGRRYHTYLRIPLHVLSPL
ncbi:hypothetical protein BD626DRAFT_504560 [Schizophyllum amplum]|uniref:Secreted protein n=1 Tax=Schizophyllum amplum TaxID=97359 RepID=A0A550C723_9AGAR|nr:hypothetical protein BD626DRAFT_504560 [Auriculariopsis ampla]